MKKGSIALLMVAALIMGACNSGENKAGATQEPAAKATLSREEIKTRSFDELFTKIAPQDIKEDVFTLVSKDFTVLTGGTPERYNSMVAGWGGWGTLFEKPVTWCFLRANRYTLELIKKDQIYTMSYFDNDYKGDIMVFGTQTGRDGSKMKDTQLTAVQTPQGSMAFKEAKLIIECKLVETTTVSPDDFLTEDGRKFVVDAHAEAGEYHKIVFGDIVNVWMRK